MSADDPSTDVQAVDLATRFPPHVLREYALVADGERGALIGPRGDVAWMCAPRWDDDGVFSALIGGPGIYALTPADPRFVWGGHYEEGSLIWRNRWVTDRGIIECREALAFPGDPDRAVFLRRVEAVDGDASVRLVLDVRAHFGREAMSPRRDQHGTWESRSGSLHVRWTGAPHARPDGDGGLHADVTVPEGAYHDLVLEVSRHPFDAAPVDPDRAWHRTENAWRTAVPDFRGTLADGDVRHSYAVLRGLTSASGAMVAASSMSLPERAEQGRNYDYRYAWIRDQCFVGEAIAATGPHHLLDTAVSFVADRLLADGPELRPAYTVVGGEVPDERDLNLPGYPGGRGKVGNWVNRQFQLDTFGESLLLFAAAERQDRLDSTHWHAVEVAVDAIRRLWTRPDAGVWEIDEQRWAHSRLSCASGLRAIARRAPAAQAAEWDSLADTLVADAAHDCVHPSGRWQRSPRDERVDAALLLPAVRGAVPPTDSRSRATLRAVRRDLGRDGYVYRFRHGSRPLGEAEGAFLLCGFHLALATHQVGDATDAVRWFERGRSACGPPGLYSEEYDVRQRQLRGNVPQAFVHALLVESAQRLAEPPPHGVEV